MGAAEQRATTDRGLRRVPWPVRPRSARPPDVVSRIPSGVPVTITHQGVRWINIERPTPASISYLRSNFPFHEPDLEDVLDTLQRPKLDEYDDYLFLVLQFPVHSKLTRTTTAGEVDIFVGRDFVITVHDDTVKPLSRLFDEIEREPEKRDDVFGGGAEYLLHSIVDQLLDYCIPITRRISQRLEQIDDLIFSPNSLRTIEEIATVRRDIIATRRIIKPQVQIVNVLDRRIGIFFKQGKDEEEELEAYFGDLVDKINKIYDILEDGREVIDALSATTDSISTHRLNEVIKTLTVFSVIMLPLTLISSIYGMNVPLPFSQEMHSFYGLIVSMALTAAVMLVFFRWRRWL
ncbi:MAG: magnesium transporter CorA family protein [Chloroflexia bacterium]